MTTNQANTVFEIIRLRDCFNKLFRQAQGHCLLITLQEKMSQDCFVKFNLRQEFKVAECLEFVFNRQYQDFLIWFPFINNLSLQWQITKNQLSYLCFLPIKAEFKCWYSFNREWEFNRHLFTTLETDFEKSTTTLLTKSNLPIGENIILLNFNPS